MPSPTGLPLDIIEYVPGATKTPQNSGQIEREKTVYAAVNSLTAGHYGLQELSVLYARMAARDTAPVPIVSCGSSTAYGQGASADARILMIRAVAQLQSDFPLVSGAAQPTSRDLAASMTLANGIGHIRAGVSGSTSANYLTSTTVAQIVALNPAAIVHMIGSNDYSVNMAPATFKANVASWLDQLDAGISAPHIHVLVQNHRRTNVSNPTYAWSTYGQQLKDIAEARDGVVFVDLYAAYSAAKADTTDPLGYMNADKIHLNDVGHALGADILRGVLRVNPFTLTPFVAGLDPTSTSAPADTTAPTVPTALTVGTPTDTTVPLSWTASTDAVGVTGYRVRRGGTLVGSPTGTSFTDTNLTASTTYGYTVSAVDAAGNESAQTASVSATTTATPALALSNTTAPAVSGTATTGQTLTTTNGSWSATPDAYAYQWRRAGAAISGATAATYVLVQTDEGQAITCAVTATKAGYTSATAVSNAVTPAAAGGGVADMTTGMIFDFDADTITGVADGAQPTSWTSSGGSAGALSLVQAATGARPALALNQVNGHAVVRFNAATATRLVSTATPTIVGTGATYVYVIKRTGSGTRLVGGGGSANYHTLYDAGSASGVQFAVETVAATGNTLTYQVSILNRWVLIIAIAAGSASKMVIGNEATVTGTLFTTNAIGVAVGGSGGGTGYLTGDLTKYQAFDHAFTDAEVAAKKAFMNSRYALT